VSGPTIAAVDAWQVMDSRGRPTVAAAVRLSDGSRATASVPSGASTGSHEAHELRDGGEPWLGLAVGRAVAAVRGPIGEALAGLPADDQAAVDAAMVDLDGSPGLSSLGANAVLAVSVATAKAAAVAAGLELWQFLTRDGSPSVDLPMPMVNIVSGGAHAAGLIDVQDVLVVPVGAPTFARAIEWCFRVRHATADVAGERGFSSSLVADEGGIAARLPRNEDALALVVEGIHRAGLEPGRDMALALDVAATTFADPDGGYGWRSENRRLTATELIDELVGWVSRYPVVSIEDPAAEDDWSGWGEATRRLAVAQLVGDDLFATALDRLRRGIDDGVANSVLVKPNQNGTLTGARAVLTTAREAGYTTVVSARSGETEDAWLADVAVGWRAGQIKVGSTTRGERTAKWNRLLEIEHRWPRQARLCPFPADPVS
jgi:enolase